MYNDFFFLQVDGESANVQSIFHAVIGKSENIFHALRAKSPIRFTIIFKANKKSPQASITAGMRGKRMISIQNNNFRKAT